MLNRRVNVYLDVSPCFHETRPRLSVCIKVNCKMSRLRHNQHNNHWNANDDLTFLERVCVVFLNRGHENQRERERETLLLLDTRSKNLPVRLFQLQLRFVFQSSQT